MTDSARPTIGIRVEDFRLCRDLFAQKESIRLKSQGCYSPPSYGSSLRPNTPYQPYIRPLLGSDAVLTPMLQQSATLYQSLLYYLEEKARLEMVVSLDMRYIATTYPRVSTRIPMAAICPTATWITGSCVTVR